MKRMSALLLAFVLLAGLVAPRIHAATSPASPPANAPGAAAAATLSQITGIAISPLLGTAGIGAVKYFRTPESQRAGLSWYAQPWFWGPALALVALVALKDTAGTAVPTALKKPFDVAEVFENKLSGLVATGAVVPMAMDMFKQFAPGAGASLSDAGFAAVDLSQFWGTLMVPFALLAYAAVFLVSHTIHILILISPFTTVDAALKTFRIFLLSTVAGTSFASPTVGAVWSGLIVLCCLPLAGWAFRLMVFGQIHAWDILTFRRRRFVPDTAANAAFLARKVGGVPRRTYGFVRRDASGGLVFSWRPWLLLPERTTPLPSGPLAVGRGLFHPEVLEIDGESTRDLLDLPPRFKGHEETFARIHAIGEVRDVGLRAAWSWLKGLFSSAPAHAS